MVPGPAINGSASGNTATSPRRRASASSSGVVLMAPELRANTISRPISNSIMPPAVRSAASEIPSVCSTRSPTSANSSSTLLAISTPRQAIRRFSCWLA